MPIDHGRCCGGDQQGIVVSHRSIVLVHHADLVFAIGQEIGQEGPLWAPPRPGFLPSRWARADRQGIQLRCFRRTRKPNMIALGRRRPPVEADLPAGSSASFHPLGDCLGLLESMCHQPRRSFGQSNPRASGSAIADLLDHPARQGREVDLGGCAQLRRSAGRAVFTPFSQATRD